jgi:hypothetical protein
LRTLRLHAPFRLAIFAWEFYQYAQQRLESGMAPPSVEGMRHLSKKMYFIDGQIARAKALRQVKDHWLQQECMIEATGALFGPFRPTHRRQARQEKKRMQNDNISAREA